ncbi:NepR family anti-sigma factor [Cypionkella aquatica]|nr:NepR family anti-sigma factor [Cypionkella aquatica]
MAKAEVEGQSDQIKAQIEENLKRVYQSALVEEVPDRFKQLLDQLKVAEAQKKVAAKEGQP